MQKEQVIRILEKYPEIDGEIAACRGFISELEQWYDTSGAITYDGMPKGKNSVSNPTERAAMNIPEFVREDIKIYSDKIAELQRIKAAVLQEVSRLRLKQKNVIFGFYFHRLRWEQVANCTHYSERQCKNIRDEAVERLASGFGRCTELILYAEKE